MSKEKQKVEIINEIINDCGKAPCLECMWCDEAATAHAEALYNAGYRKQSEGEWIEHEVDWGDTFYSCSVCGDERCSIDGSAWELGLNYCPNCGAKMKGGAE